MNKKPEKRIFKLKSKIYIPHAEIPVVEHCNMNCSLCNSHAYLIDESVYSLGQFKADMDILSHHLHFGLMTFMGGEPLLCKNLDEYISYAKEKQIAEVCRVLTNGLLIKNMSEKLMTVMDVLEISYYPEMNMTIDEINAYLKPLSKKYRFTYYIKEIKYFNCIDAIDLTDEDAQRGYEKCQRIIDVCNIFNGYYYKCMRPKTTNLYLEKEHGITDEVDMRSVDGFKICEDNFEARFEEYKNRTEKLAACKYCLMGTESESFMVSATRRLAYGSPWIIKRFYKCLFLYHGFKMYKKLFQYDEGAHCLGINNIKTEHHDVKKNVIRDVFN